MTADIYQIVFEGIIAGALIVVIHILKKVKKTMDDLEKRNEQDVG